MSHVELRGVCGDVFVVILCDSFARREPISADPNKYATICESVMYKKYWEYENVDKNL